MHITTDILSALSAAIEKAGSQAEFARRAGVSPVYIGRYLSKKNKEISLENQIKIWPLIKPFLPPGFVEGFEKEFDIGEMEKMLDLKENISLKEQRLSKKSKNRTSKNELDTFQLMLKMLNEIGSDGLLSQIMIRWTAFSDEEKKEVFKYIDSYFLKKFNLETQKD